MPDRRTAKKPEPVEKPEEEDSDEDEGEEEEEELEYVEESVEDHRFSRQVINPGIWGPPEPLIADTGSEVNLHIIGRYVVDEEKNKKKIFFSTYMHRGGKPIRFVLGQQQTIVGLEAALAVMPIEARWVITIPYEFAFGTYGNPNGFHGQGDPIPGKKDLEFDVFLIGAYTRARLNYDTELATLEIKKLVAVIEIRTAEADQLFDESKEAQRANMHYYKVMATIEQLVHMDPSLRGRMLPLLLRVLLNCASTLLALASTTFPASEPYDPSWVMNEVVELCTKSLILSPLNIDALRRRAKATALMGEHRRCLTDLRQILTLCKNPKLREMDKSVDKLAEAVSKEIHEVTKEWKMHKSEIARTGKKRWQGLFERNVYDKELLQQIEMQKRKAAEIRKQNQIAKTNEDPANPFLGAKNDFATVNQKNQMTIDLNKLPTEYLLSDKGITKRVLRRGAGPTPNHLRVRDKQKAKICYIAREGGSGGSPGKEWGENWNRKEPFEFPVNCGEMIVGLEEAILTMQCGEMAIITIDPKYCLTPKVEGIKESRWQKIEDSNNEVPQTALEFEIELCGLDRCDENIHPEMDKREKEDAYLKLKELGNLFVSQQEHAIAKHYYLKALTYLKPFDKSRVGLYLNLALCRLNDNKNLDAIYYTSLAECLDGNNIKVYLRRSKAFENVDQYEEALLNLLRAMEIAEIEKKQASDKFEEAKKKVEVDLRRIQRQVKEMEEEEKKTEEALKDAPQEAREANCLKSARKKKNLAMLVTSKKEAFDDKKMRFEKAERMSKNVQTLLKRVAQKDKLAKKKQKQNFGGFLGGKKKKTKEVRR